MPGFLVFLQQMCSDIHSWLYLRPITVTHSQSHLSAGIGGQHKQKQEFPYLWPPMTCRRWPTETVGWFFWGGITSLLLSKSKFSMLLQWTSLKRICKCPAYNTPHLLSSCGQFKMVKYKLCLHHRILLRSFSGPLVLGSNLSWAQSLLCRLTFPQGLKSCWERSLWVVH